MVFRVKNGQSWKVGWLEEGSLASLCCVSRLSSNDGAVSG